MWHEKAAEIGATVLHEYGARLLVALVLLIVGIIILVSVIDGWAWLLVPMSVFFMGSGGLFCVLFVFGLVRPEAKAQGIEE